MYTGVKSLLGVIENFNVGVGVHQRSVINLYLFSVVMDDVTKEIQGDVL